MPEYIEKEAMKTAVRKRLNNSLIISWLISIINEVPVAKVAPVVHGRWINEGVYVTTAYGSLDVYRCSVCDREITIDDFDSYCPNCGARMDGEG